MDPMKVLREAIQAVPAVKWALGVAGIAASVALVAGFQVDLKIAVFGTIIMLGLMFVLVVFAKASSAEGSALAVPVLVATWGFLLVTLASAILLATSWFFQWPADLDGRELFSGGSSVCLKFPAYGSGGTLVDPKDAVLVRLGTLSNLHWRLAFLGSWEKEVLLLACDRKAKRWIRLRSFRSHQWDASTGRWSLAPSYSGDDGVGSNGLVDLGVVNDSSPPDGTEYLVASFHKEHEPEPLDDANRFAWRQSRVSGDWDGKRLYDYSHHRDGLLVAFDDGNYGVARISFKQR